MVFREFDSARDREACYRIWREIGWLEDQQNPLMDLWVDSGRALIAEIGGEAECLVLTAPGNMRYQDADLPLSCVTGVTTSRIARKQGLAGQLTARAVAADAADGKLVSMLGAFEQGYYDRLGFGTGCYEHHVQFDPAKLSVKGISRPPLRITAGDWQEAHAARLARFRSHGGCNFNAPQITRADMELGAKRFGLGFRDDADKISHYVWLEADKVENGPYSVKWIVYRTREQFLELMAVIKSLGDQVRLVRMEEPPGIQLQDLIQQPFKHRAMSRGSQFEAGIHGIAYWQARILDLAGCLSRTRLGCKPLSFNLALTDPIQSFLEPDSSWRGMGGDYAVTLGPESSAEPGSLGALPALSASAGAFTRLWLGVRPATGLAITDDLAGEPALLDKLDRILCLPPPKPDWEF